MWIPDSNCSTIESGGVFPMNSLQGIKEVMTSIPTLGKGGGCFLQIFVAKLVLQVNRSGEGSDNENEKCIRLQN